MRRAILSVLALFVVSCIAPSGENQAPVDDDRYDLMAVNMPPLLTKDAKSCTKVFNFGGVGNLESDDPVKQAFNFGLDFWQALDASMLSDENTHEVLPYGGDPKNVPSILPKGIKLPTKIAHACGEYAGEVVVKIGILSLEESVEIAHAVDPELFERMGTSLEQVKDGLSVLAAAAEKLSPLPIDDRVHCVAIYQAAASKDKSLSTNLNIWMMALVDAIENGDLDSKGIREKSVFWQALATSGPQAVISTEGFQEQASKCDRWINNVMPNQAAN